MLLLVHTIVKDANKYSCEISYPVFLSLGLFFKFSVTI
jgi:hypothetical protein